MGREHQGVRHRRWGGVVSANVMHLPQADEVRCVVRTSHGPRRGVRKKAQVFGGFVAVKFDGRSHWEYVPRNDVSVKQ